MLVTFHVLSLYPLRQTSIMALVVGTTVGGLLGIHILASFPNWILICFAASPSPAPSPTPPTPQDLPDYLRGN